MYELEHTKHHCLTGLMIHLLGVNSDSDKLNPVQKGKKQNHCPLHTSRTYMVSSPRKLLLLLP